MGDFDGDIPSPKVRAEMAAAIAELSRSTTESTSTMEHLVEQVRRDANAREKKIQVLEVTLDRTRRLQQFMGAGLVLLLALAVFNASTLSAVRANALVSADIAKDSQGTYRLLLDCLDQVHGACGKQTAVQTAKLLEQIKQYELTVIFCARTHPAVEDPDGVKFRVCVNQLFPGGPQLPADAVSKGGKHP